MSDVNKTETPQHIIVTPTKSVAISIILTFLFGPLGLLYSTVSGGIIMIVIGIILFILTAGLGLIPTWPVCMIWGVIAVSNSNKKVLNQISKKV